MDRTVTVHDFREALQLNVSVSIAGEVSMYMYRDFELCARFFPSDEDAEAIGVALYEWSVEATNCDEQNRLLTSNSFQKFDIIKLRKHVNVYAECKSDKSVWLEMNNYGNYSVFASVCNEISGERLTIEIYRQDATRLADLLLRH